LNSAQDQLAQARLARLQASVTLFRVLGGGWTDTQTTAAARS
jgi:outer membrane protein TolC